MEPASHCTGVDGHSTAGQFGRSREGTRGSRCCGAFWKGRLRLCWAPAVRLGAQVKGISQQNQGCLVKSLAGVTSVPPHFLRDPWFVGPSWVVDDTGHTLGMA